MPQRQASDVSGPAPWPGGPFIAIMPYRDERGTAFHLGTGSKEAESTPGPPAFFSEMYGRSIIVEQHPDGCR